MRELQLPSQRTSQRRARDLWPRAVIALGIFVALGCAPPPAQKPGTLRRAGALAALSKAYPDVHWQVASAVRADFDCDSIPDIAFLGEDAQFEYVGLARGVGGRTDILRFNRRGSSQDALCAGKPELKRRLQA